MDAFQLRRRELGDARSPPSKAPGFRDCLTNGLQHAIHLAGRPDGDPNTSVAACACREIADQNAAPLHRLHERLRGRTYPQQNEVRLTRPEAQAQLVEKLPRPSETNFVLVR